MIIGTKIKQLRERNKISQLDLAIKLGIGQTTIASIESGNTTKIDFNLINKLCKEFNVDFQYFVEDSKFKQINRDKSAGNISENQNNTIYDKLIEQYEERIKEMKNTIEDLKKSQKKKED
ncbi:MAG TPA: helix-turn-helix transcriptional regulator [Flavobacterium sp.]|uniref:helix-turn-helix domain-containing protein n=1 Tax=unclassified Flavobacterium TaxID=196869 RepID=UPI0025BAF672|nr:MULTISPECIES: helix-turn-helix transcriptional regulator [unclassified Flavobacterium]HRE76349.1 helix-turn-helix transcriptional regulator [Flavobacterium sp.]